MTSGVIVTMPAATWGNIIDLCDTFSQVIEESFTKQGQEKDELRYICTECGMSREHSNPTIAPGCHWEECWIAEVAVRLRDIRNGV